MLKIPKGACMALVAAALVFVTAGCEARSVVVSQVNDSNAKASYAKQVAEYQEIVNQTQQLERQIENMKQALEHFSFSNLNQSYRFLTTAINDIESIQKSIDVIAGNYNTFDSDWTAISESYDSGSMTTETMKEFEKARKERLEKSNKRAAKTASLYNPTEARKTLDNIKEYMSVFESGKTSPVKAVQALSGLVSQQIAETKSLQTLQAERLRQAVLKEQLEADRQAQLLAEAERQHDNLMESIETSGSYEIQTTYPGPVMNKSDFQSAVGTTVKTSSKS